MVVYVLVLCYSYVRLRTMLNYGDTSHQMVRIQQDSKETYTSDEVDFDFMFTLGSNYKKEEFTFYSPEELKEYVEIRVDQKLDIWT